VAQNRHAGSTPLW